MKNNYGKTTLPESDPALAAIESPLLKHSFIMGDICAQIATTETASLTKAEQAWEEANVKAGAELCFVCERPADAGNRLQDRPLCAVCGEWLAQQAGKRRQGLARILVEVTRPDKARFTTPQP